MKKKFLLFVTLCLAHIISAQVKVNSVGNTGIGGTPNAKAKLLLYNKLTSNDSIFGLHSTMWNTLENGPSSSSNRPMYGIYSINTNQSYSPLYGAYFKNTLSNTLLNGTPGPLYGIYMDNNNSTYSTSSYGVYVNNTNSNYTGTTYGFYAKNSASRYGGGIYGLYSDNIGTGYSSTIYGVYSVNDHQATYGAVYGAYFSVSGAQVNSRYAGYFNGGKVVVMNGNVGIGREQPAYLLDVNGTIRVSSTLYSSDERLKSDIKPLTDEKDKLYLLQGKSYKKALIPVNIKDSLTLAAAQKTKEKTIETPEYGYLAQELKEVFPDLVSRDSAGYYSVNYIGLIPVIIEALKDQRLEIENKQNQIEEQQIENKKQQNQIEKQQIQIDEQREQIKQLIKLMNIKSIDKKAFEENGIESVPLLLQNTPNPFNQVTEIGYFIPETVSSANIYIYDVNGVQQRNISIAERGNGVTVLQATALQAGIYFYTLICDGKPVDTKQMILTR